MPSNNFAALKENNAVKKIYLLRMNPARDITDDLVLDAGSIYECTINLKVNKVTLNGVELTKVDNLTADKQYTFNESTGELRVYTLSAPGDDFTFIAYHYLFFTDDQFRYVPQTPTDSATVTREWEPRLFGGIDFSQSVENIIQGTLSIAYSAIKLKNNDAYFQNFLGFNESFYNKKIELWLCLDTVDNIKKVYEGVVTEVLIDSETASFKVEDILSRLQQPASFGTPTNYQYYNDDASIGITVSPNKAGTVVPFIIGRFSKYALINAAIATRPNARKLDPESLLEAICITYSATISGTTNRAWGLCLSYDSVPLVFPTLSSMTVDNSDANCTKIHTITPAINFDYIFVGDQMAFVNGGSSKYLDIIEVDYVNSFIYVEKDAGLTSAWQCSADTVTTSVFLQRAGVNTRLRQGRDYGIFNAMVDSVGGGDFKTMVYLFFNNNFETALGIPDLDPINDRIVFRIRFNNWGHGEILKRALNSAGIVTNDASFAQADIDLPVNCNFSVPYIDESDIRPYYGYIEDILKSTLGFLRMNSSFEVEYNLFAAPTAPAEITDSNIVRDSLNLEIKYKDITNEIIAYNAHLDAEDIVSKDPTNTPSKTLKNNRSLYLHDCNNTDRFRHVVDNIVPTLQKILAIRSERRVNYVLSTKGSNLDSQLGDEFKVVNDHALASPANEGVIVSIDGEQIIISEIPL